MLNSTKQYYLVWFLMSNIKYRRGKHSVSLIHAHLVFVVKYRKEIFEKKHILRLEQIFQEVSKKMDFQVLQFNGESDHIHLLIEYPPKLSVSKIVNSLKGVSSRLLRKEFALFPSSTHLWSPSYFCVSCGGASLAKIKKYIASQNVSS